MELPINTFVVCPAIVGRTAELAALHAIVGEVEGGHSRVVLLSGEAGIGKSRLVAEIETEARSRGFSVLQGNCFQRDLASPYAPLLDLVRSSVTNHPLSVREAELQPFAQEFFPVLPDLIPPPPAPAALPTPGPEQEQRRLFVALTAFFTRLSAGHPLLFVIEDIHWCDESSLDFLQYFLRQSTPFPWLVLLTYRSDELHPVFINWLAQQDRERRAREFSLARLTYSDVDAMLSAIFDLDLAMRSELLNTLYPLTEGNPFFVEEVLTSLRAAGGIFYAEGAWRSKRLERLRIPRSIEAAVRQRTERLSEEARELLTLAAVAGRRFDVDLLLSITRQTEEQLLHLLKELMVAQLVVEESADHFAFRHALTREAIYTELLGRERKALHRSIADTLERLYASLLDAHLGDLAYHFYEAGAWREAFEYAKLAGEKALSFYAPRAAIDSFTHALTAAYQLALIPPSSLSRARGQAYELLGEFDRARADYEAALQGARSTGERRAQWEALLHLGMLWAGRDYAQAGTWFRDALTLASELEDPALQARSLNRLGNWLVNTGQPEEGLQAHQEALVLFETIEDTQGMAETLDLLGQAHGLHSELITSVKEFGQAIDLFRALNNTQSLVSSLTSRAVYAGPNLAETTLSALLTRDECLRDTAEAIQLARRIDSPADQAYAEFVSGMLLTSFGEFGTALIHAQEALRLATEIQHQQWMAGASFVLGRLSVLLLDAPSAILTLEAGLVLASHVGSAWWAGNITAYLALAYLLSNEYSRAEALLEASLPHMQHPRTSPERRLSWVRGELALAQGYPDIALDIADTLLITAPGADSTKQPIPWLLKLKGEALAALHRTEEAIAVLREAERGALQRRELALLWRIFRAAGYAHRHLKQEEQARHHFRSARQGIASLASTIDDGPLHDQFLQAALSTLPREKPIAAKRAAKQTFGGLTEREREVVALIAQGKSNREIAEALVVAKITVETHINNILHKLGFTSRAQIMLWAIERGLAKH